MSTMEALMLYFPKDIANMIHRIKDKSEHQDNLHVCIEQIHCMELDKDIMEKKYLLMTNGFNDLEYCLNIISKYKCCKDHKIYNPTTSKYLDPCDYRITCSPPRTRIGKKCDCSCRHVARNLIRIHIYTELEYNEDERNIFHQKYFTNTEKYKQVQNDIKNAEKERLVLYAKINTDENQEQEMVDQLYYNYYASLDKVMEIRTKLCNAKLFLEEAVFNLHSHIEDYPEIFSHADMVFMKYRKNNIFICVNKHINQRQ